MAEGSTLTRPLMCFSGRTALGLFGIAGKHQGSEEGPGRKATPTRGRKDEATFLCRPCMSTSSASPPQSHNQAVEAPQSPAAGLRPSDLASGHPSPESSVNPSWAGQQKLLRTWHLDKWDDIGRSLELQPQMVHSNLINKIFFDRLSQD